MRNLLLLLLLLLVRVRRVFCGGFGNDAVDDYNDALMITDLEGGEGEFLMWFYLHMLLGMVDGAVVCSRR